MKLYLDGEFKLHTSGEGLREIETDKFDNMCDELINCYRYVPAGEIYVKPNGEIIHGEFIQPHCKTDKARVYQLNFEHDKEVKALQDSLADMIEIIYEEDK